MNRLPQSVLGWLLEPREPAVRYQSLRDIVGESVESHAVKDAYSQIARKGWVFRILDRQLQGGYWHNYELLHWPKYVSTAYMVMILVDLGLRADNPKLKLSCDLLLRVLSQTEEGGFAFGKSSHFCVTGNFARTFIKAGYADDRRVQRALEWIVDSQKEDGGWHCFPSKHGTLDCWEGLSAFAALPREKWTRGIKNSVERGVSFYLERRLWKEGQKRYEPWFRFHYPVHYYYDLLVGLDVMTSLGCVDDVRLKPALDVLKKKRKPDGKWILDAVPPDIAPGDPYQSGPPFEPFPPIRFGLEKVGMPSKMITLRALRVLQRITV
jgi:hypothetical protein